MDILIVSPGNYATGGVELLHQLCFEMNKRDEVNAQMWYWECKTMFPQPREYKQYGCKYVTAMPEGFNGLIVFPEIWANRVTDPKYKDCKVAVFWESVDNYFKFSMPNDYYRFLERKDTIHLVQSFYAEQFCADLGLLPWFIGDYINEDFMQPYSETDKRYQWVLYNPKKGMDFTEKLIGFVGNAVAFVPIQNMSREEVIDTMRHSMLYIDFGDHPGKERIPREAAMCGCCIITGRNGSAGNKSDVDIPERYKFTRWEQSLIGIREMIIDTINEYPWRTNDFNHYRKKIAHEQEAFEENVEEFVEWLRCQL